MSILIERIRAAGKSPNFGSPPSKSVRKTQENPYPVDTSAELLLLQNSFVSTPLTVSFRKLVSWIKVGERATHYLHPYPAKLLPQIAHFFLAASVLSKPGNLVLDPFGGTGTVALEALLAGRRALQSDANPLARLIAQTKTKLLSEKSLQQAFANLQSRYKLARAKKVSDVVNVDYWYGRDEIRALSRLRIAITGENQKKIREFLLVTFSAVARKASNADLRFSVPVRKKTSSEDSEVTRPSVWELFEAQFKANVARQRALREMSPKLGTLECAGYDARNLKAAGAGSRKGQRPLDADSIDLIITSPPYAGAQKYVRASSLSLGWLGLAAQADLRSLEKKSIGREHLAKSEVGALPDTGLPEANAFVGLISGQNSRRGAIIATYLAEMRVALLEAVRVLRPGGHFVLVIGDNQVCGQEFASSKFLTSILEEYGLVVKVKLLDEIRSRGLITKRHKTSGMITREWVILFAKPGNA